MPAGKKILIIEDDKEVRESITEIVENAGYYPIPMEDGLVAIRFLEHEIPDLIISDIMMPNVDGYGVLEHVKSILTTSTVPFIFITAKADYADIRSGMIHGAEDYITKPFRARDLILSIETQLKKKEKMDIKFEHICDNISAFIPHELTTPIVSIVGYPDLIIENYKTFSEQEIFFMLSQIKLAGLRLNKTLGKFIKYADIQSRIGIKNQGASVEIIPSHVLSAVNIITKKLAEYSERTGDLEINMIEAELCIEHEDLEFIIEELLANAMKFSGNGTPISLCGEIKNNLYQIEVTDNGRGMTNQQILEFLPFTQHERKFYEQQGLGLGLVTIKKITEYYRGSFRITSEINRYTKCIVTLPVIKNK